MNASRSHYDRVARLVVDVLRKHEKRALRFLRDESEIHKWVAFDDAVYAPGLVTFELLSQWWISYPKGAIGLFTGDRIDGVFGIWPFTRSAFKAVLEGRKQEKDIRGEDILREQQLKSCRHWFISGFAIGKNLRSTREMMYFLKDATGIWRDNSRISFPVDICAFGYSDEGEALLRTFGFSRQAPFSSSDYWPVYLLSLVDSNDLRQKLERLERLERVDIRVRWKEPTERMLRRYPEYCRKFLKTNVPQCDPIITALIDEASKACDYGLLQCSAFAIGAASEKAIYLLIEAYGDAIADDTNKQRFKEATSKNRAISKQFDDFKQSYRSSKTKSANAQLIHDQLSILETLFTAYRLTRNQIGHPRTIPNLRKTDVLAKLGFFCNYVSTVYEMIEFFQRNPVVV
jgi:hypothetical protein